MLKILKLILQKLKLSNFLVLNIIFHLYIKKMQKLLLSYDINDQFIRVHTVPEIFAII